MFCVFLIRTYFLFCCLWFDETTVRCERRTRNHTSEKSPVSRITQKSSRSTSSPFLPISAVPVTDWKVKDKRP